VVHIDMNRPDDSLAPGVDLWQIVSCTAKPSRGGDNMLALKFERVDGGGNLFDNVMLGGGGWGIGKQKLAALVEPGFTGDLDPISLVGKRLWIETVVDNFEGRDRLKVNIKGLKHGGYQRADDVPPGCTMPAVDEAPF